MFIFTFRFLHLEVKYDCPDLITILWTANNQINYNTTQNPSGVLIQQQIGFFQLRYINKGTVFEIVGYWVSFFISKISDL